MTEENETEDSKSEETLDKTPDNTLMEEEVLEFENEGEYEVEEWIGDDWGEEEDEEEEYVPEGPQYVDNGNDTVSDTRRNLMWAKKDSFHAFGYGINWYEANDYVEELNEKKFAGFDDWRLCSFDEATSLFAFAVSNVDKDGAEVHIDPLFEPGGGHNTWTYEEKPDYSQYAMLFSFVTGNEKWEHKDNEYCHIRAVRDEIKDEWEPEWRKDSKKFEG